MLNTNWKRCTITGLAAMCVPLAAIVVTSPAYAAGDPASIAASSGEHRNPNPGIVPNRNDIYGNLGAKWWQWAFSFPAADVPFFNTGGPVDVSAGQSGHIWFLSGANGGLSSPRTGTVPSGKSLFFPIANLINDYPCPPA